MFGKILCANDGSEIAFHALTLAVTMAKENAAELHVVSVEEIDYMPEFNRGNQRADRNRGTTFPQTEENQITSCGSPLRSKPTFL
jgi:nucleotide-binding universal stress UspA family protein